MWAIFVFCLCEVEVVLHKERPLNVEVIECGLLQVFAITGIIEVMVNCANYCLAAIITIITDYRVISLFCKYT